MEKLKNVVHTYILPLLVVIIIFIPFISIDGTGSTHVHISPIEAIIRWSPYSIGLIIYGVIGITYLIFAYINQNKTRSYIRRIMLFASVILYFLIFKLTSNTNLNLFCVIINMIVAAVYIVNFIRDYLIKPIEDNYDN